ncbi:hypothetical protein AYI69_g11086 [Smittium culicis]|uniref:PX domain-containing protein n=1 Tax=Smittium culicis TaxID=133412 RepID=A0A1R1X162_9FUNG|nr:hypothetical protein AYI69_g11086 [Smittium culicis]
MISCIISQAEPHFEDILFLIYCKIQKSVSNKNSPKTDIAPLSADSFDCILSPASSNSTKVAVRFDDEQDDKPNSWFSIKRTYSQFSWLNDQLSNSSDFFLSSKFPDRPQINLLPSSVYLERKKSQFERWISTICFTSETPQSKYAILHFFTAKNLIVPAKKENGFLSWITNPYIESQKEYSIKLYKPSGQYVEWDEDLINARKKHISRLETSYLQLKQAVHSIFVQQEELDASQSVFIYDLKEMLQNYNSNSLKNSLATIRPIDLANKRHIKRISRSTELLSSLHKINILQNRENKFYNNQEFFDPLNEILQLASCYKNNLNYFFQILAKYDRATLHFAECNSNTELITSNYPDTSNKYLKAKKNEETAKNELETCKTEFSNIKSKLDSQTFKFEKLRYSSIKNCLLKFSKFKTESANNLLYSLSTSLHALRSKDGVTLTYKPQTNIGNLMLNEIKTPISLPKNKHASGRVHNSSSLDIKGNPIIPTTVASKSQDSFFISQNHPSDFEFNPVISINNSPNLSFEYPSESSLIQRLAPEDYLISECLVNSGLLPKVKLIKPRKSSNTPRKMSFYKSPIPSSSKSPIISRQASSSSFVKNRMSRTDSKNQEMYHNYDKQIYRNRSNSIRISSNASDFSQFTLSSITISKPAADNILHPFKIGTVQSSDTLNRF